MESKVTYIRGSKKYPEKVIEHLETLGGFNSAHLQGTSVETYYYIDSNRRNQITITANPLKEGSVIIENIEDTLIKESRIFIKGDSKYGLEIIEYLESLGGQNKQHFNGFCDELYYYIRSDNKTIDYVNRLPENYKLLTYPDIKNQNKKQNLQILDIEVPEGYTLEYNPETQKIEFIPCRSRSWEEFCKNHPIIKNEWYFDNIKTWTILGLHEVERTNQKSLLETKEDAEGVVALIQLTRLHDEWVGDWKEDTVTYYSISTCLRGDKVSVFDANTMNYMHSLLVFPTKEMAHEFLECHKDLIEKAKKFI